MCARARASVYESRHLMKKIHSLLYWMDTMYEYKIKIAEYRYNKIHRHGKKLNPT